jgi:hypothetical protein
LPATKAPVPIPVPVPGAAVPVEPPIRSATPPICAPCLDWKLCIVDAAEDISDAETEEGFRWRLDAVCSAARFCAKVVPVGWAWGVVEGDEGPMPKPGTETPAEERREMAVVLR